jgi:hypothetical protein
VVGLPPEPVPPALDLPPLFEAALGGSLELHAPDQKKTKPAARAIPELVP